MKSKFFIQSVLTMPLLLVAMFFLVGCQQTLTTHSSATENPEYWAAVTKALCRNAWRPVTYSSRDTEQTKLEARANNAARKKYCVENEPY